MSVTSSVVGALANTDTIAVSKYGIADPDTFEVFRTDDHGRFVGAYWYWPGVGGTYANLPVDKVAVEATGKMDCPTHVYLQRGGEVRLLCLGCGISELVAHGLTEAEAIELSTYLNTTANEWCL